MSTTTREQLMLDPQQRLALQQTSTGQLPVGGYAPALITQAKCLLELDEAVERLTERLEFLEHPEDMT